MQTNNPAQVYTQRLDWLGEQLKNFLKRKNTLSLFRLFSFILAGIALWKLWPLSWLAAVIAFALLFTTFILFVVRDVNNREEIENTRRLIQINQEELTILAHHFTDRPDGQRWKPEHHAYANDLDILGKASLYQYINRTHSEQGNRLMAEWLLHPAESDMIPKRQEAARELSKNVFSLQQFRAHGMANAVTLIAEEKIVKWLQQKNRFRNRPGWTMSRFIFPLVTITVLGLFLFSTISLSAFLSLLVLFFAIAFSITKYIMPDYNVLNRIVPELETLYQSICWIESLEINSGLIQSVKESTRAGEQPASVSIRKLKKILERLDYRYNPLVHVPLNVFFLWDLQQVLSLEAWKSANKKMAAPWFNALAEMESLVTLALICFNHPQWCFPGIAAEHGTFNAIDLGHPLIPIAKRVNNSFRVNGSRQLSLITGSNMAGKSTFLRSAGVNVVLAMMGSPVCARDFELANMKVISSMRVNDNLEENTSTFYAELKKLKEIIEAVNNHEKVILLLDEILRGTNSADRHMGSEAFIKQLVREKACALVATHDLELTRLAEDFPAAIHNYHFDVQVQGDELYFDYILKDGICRSMNASLLMKKIGINL